MERARAEKKPMLIDFAVAKGCPRCDFLQKNVYIKDEIVRKINSDFVSILIDLSKKRHLRKMPSEKNMIIKVTVCSFPSIITAMYCKGH